jgi:hypothetical protein
MSGVNIYKVKDKKEKFYTDKGLLFNLPFRILMVGKSQFSGKSSCIVNLLLQDDKRLYKNEFDGDNIYIFSGSLKTDNKMKLLIKQFDIPESNLFEEYSEEALEAIYELTEEEYEEAMEEKERPKNTLVILDDLAFGGDLKKKNAGMINKIFCNGRHINLSIIATAQKYGGQLHTTQRENCSGIILWDCSDKQLDLIADDHNILEDKKSFKKMFRKRTEKPFSFMVVNYSNPRSQRYLSMNFEPIGSCGRTKSEGCPCFPSS